MVALADKGFEEAIVTIVKDVKEHMFIMKEHERNLSREIGIVTKHTRSKFKSK